MFDELRCLAFLLAARASPRVRRPSRYEVQDGSWPGSVDETGKDLSAVGALSGSVPENGELTSEVVKI